MGALRVLLSEGSSLTSREYVTVLGTAGIDVEVMSSDRWAVCRWSRWVHRVHRCPPADADPVGYLAAVAEVLQSGRIDALLATHEQAWLFAVGRDRLPAGAPVAVASPDAFARVESKLAFASLLDELGLPQPAWEPVDCAAALDELSYPYFLKAPFSTAGRGVQLIREPAEREAALAVLKPGWGDRARGDAGEGMVLMAQRPTEGEYGQVQGLFDRGRLVAVHTSVQTGLGMGGSAAARLSVDHPEAREGIALVGRALGWHGGLTLDYLHHDGSPVFIECNPRTVEPANAVAAGVPLPMLSIDLAARKPLPDELVIGRAGVRTHGTMALLLGRADVRRSRRALVRLLLAAATHRPPFAGSTEVLTPLWHDPRSAVPLLTVAASVLARPGTASATAARAVAAYSVSPDAIGRMPPPTGPAR